MDNSGLNHKKKNLFKEHFEIPWKNVIEFENVWDEFLVSAGTRIKLGRADGIWGYSSQKRQGTCRNFQYGKCIDCGFPRFSWESSRISQDSCEISLGRVGKETSMGEGADGERGVKALGWKLIAHWLRVGTGRDKSWLFIGELVTVWLKFHEIPPPRHFGADGGQRTPAVAAPRHLAFSSLCWEMSQQRDTFKNDPKSFQFEWI